MSNHIIQSPKIYSVRSDPTLLPHCRGGSVHRTDILCVLIGAQYSPSNFDSFTNQCTDHTVFPKSVLTATNNTIDMWDWAFWNIIAEWLRLRSGWMLFWMIWRRWSRAYQWFPTHPGLVSWYARLHCLVWHFRYMYHYVWILVVIKGQRGQGRGRLI